VTAPGGRREKDRWHQLADAIGASNLTASDKSVFRALLDRADYGTAVMQHRFTETQATIARKTSHSQRMVRYAIRHLERHGWLTAKGKTGPGLTLDYSLTAGGHCDCTGRVHEPKPDSAAAQRRQPQAPTAATSTPRTAATNGGNAAGQTPVRTERHLEGGRERRLEPNPGPEPGPKYGPQPVLVSGDSGGPDDRDDFNGWLALISGRAEPSRGTPPGRQP
jgi:hypothetical protein